MNDDVAYIDDLEIKYDKRLSNFVVAYFFVQALNLLIKNNYGNLFLWDYVSKGILIIFLMLCMMPVIKRGFISAIVGEALLIAMLSYTVLSGGADYSEYGTIMINAVTVFMPMAIAVAKIKNKGVLLNRFYYVSWLTQVVLILVLLNIRGGSYSMPGGYAMVFQLLIIMDHFFETHKWYDLIAIIIDSLVILIFGSRGPIICIVVMILLYIAFSRRISRKKRMALIIIISVVAVIIYSNLSVFINALGSLFDALGYQSRSLKMLMQNIIQYDSGRIALYDFYLLRIRDRPLLGYGLVGGWKSPASYPHHLFIELLLSFGIFWGTIFCLIVILISLNAAISKEKDVQRITQILVAYCSSLFLSDSFMMCPMFFMLMAIGFSNMGVRFYIGAKRL